MWRQGLHRHQEKCKKKKSHECTLCCKSFTRKDSLAEYAKVCKEKKGTRDVTNATKFSKLNEC